MAPIIHDTLHESSRARSVEFVKIGREQNKVAHELAHRALVSGECRVYFAALRGASLPWLVKTYLINIAPTLCAKKKRITSAAS